MVNGPCPGNNLCCNRPIFDRTIFPCSIESRLRRLEEVPVVYRHGSAIVANELTITEASEVIELLTRESSTSIFATEKTPLYLKWKSVLDRRFLENKKESTTTDALIQARRDTIAEIFRSVK